MPTMPVATPQTARVRQQAARARPGRSPLPGPRLAVAVSAAGAAPSGVAPDGCYETCSEIWLG